VKGDESSVWVADADGSNSRKVASGADGGLSPDGRWLTYSDPDDWRQSFLRDLENGRTRDLGLVWALAWSADSTELAISNGKQLLLLDPKGGQPHELARGKIWSVSFSPNGTAIVFSNGNIPSEEEKWTDVFVVRLSDDRVSRLTTDGDSDHPVWGGSWIAFSRHRCLKEYGPDYGWIYELYVMRPDGSDVHELTISGETAGHGKDDDFLRFGLVPRQFSADGKRLLARVSLELGPEEIVTFAVPNGPGRKITDAKEEGAIWTADLSPDGNRVLFEDGALDDEQHHSISTMPFEGGKRRLLLSNATQASWARGIPRSRDDAG
jgi:Tol biopolymer transport system component